MAIIEQETPQEETERTIKVQLAVRDEETYDFSTEAYKPLTNNKWYGHAMIQWEIAKQLQYKYLSIRKKLPSGKFMLVRYLLGYNPSLIIKSVEKYGGFQPHHKYYFDLTHWKDMPMFAFDPSKRAVQRNDFDSNWTAHYAGYDYAIDLDAKDKQPMTAYKDAKIIKTFFDANRIPYSIKFSGSKGFHFLIEYKYLPKKIYPMNLPGRCYKATRWIVDRFDLKNVDDSIYDHRRILKLAYSLDGDNVVLPLNDKQFDEFDLSAMTADRVLKEVQLYNRGLLVRTHGQTPDQLRRNVARLFQGKSRMV